MDEKFENARFWETIFFDYHKIMHPFPTQSTNVVKFILVGVNRAVKKVYEMRWCLIQGVNIRVSKRALIHLHTPKCNAWIGEDRATLARPWTNQSIPSMRCIIMPWHIFSPQHSLRDLIVDIALHWDLEVSWFRVGLFFNRRPRNYSSEYTEFWVGFVNLHE